MGGIVAVLAPVLDLLKHLLRAVHLLGIGAHGQSPGLNGFVGLVLAGHVKALTRTDAMADQPQWTLGRVLRVLLPHRTSRCVTGVREHLQPLRLALRIHRGEILHRDKHLAANFHQLWVIAFELIGDIAQRACIMGDVLTRGAIAAGQRQFQIAVDVQQVDGGTVDLQLGQVSLRRRAIQPRLHRFLIEDIVQAQHPLPVIHVPEWTGFQRRRGHFGRGAGLRDRLRVLAFKVLQPAQQGIKVLVAEGRLTVVVALAVRAHLFGQLLPLFLNIAHLAESIRKPNRAALVT